MALQGWLCPRNAERTKIVDTRYEVDTAHPDRAACGWLRTHRRTDTDTYRNTNYSDHTNLHGNARRAGSCVIGAGDRSACCHCTEWRRAAVADLDADARRCPASNG